MQTGPGNRPQREWNKVEAVADNGLLDRRAFLRGGPLENLESAKTIANF